MISAGCISQLDYAAKLWGSYELQKSLGKVIQHTHASASEENKCVAIPKWRQGTSLIQGYSNIVFQVWNLKKRAAEGTCQLFTEYSRGGINSEMFISCRHVRLSAYVLYTVQIVEVVFFACALCASCWQVCVTRKSDHIRIAKCHIIIMPICSNKQGTEEIRSQGNKTHPPAGPGRSRCHSCLHSSPHTESHLHTNTNPHTAPARSTTNAWWSSYACFSLKFVGLQCIYLKT